MKKEQIIALKQDIEENSLSSERKVEITKTIISLIPEGQGKAWKRSLQYALSAKNLVIPEGSLNGFFTNGYSQHSKIIMLTLADLVIDMITDETEHLKRVEKIKSEKV